MKDDRDIPAHRRRALGWFAPGISIVLSCATIFYYGAERADFGDANDYVAAARSLLEGKGYPFESSIPTFRPPLYPLLIAAVWSIAPVENLWIKLVQAVLLAACCRVLYKLGVLVHNNQVAAFSGALIFALNPYFLAQVAEIQTETLFTSLIAVAVCLIARPICSDQMKARSLVPAGLALGLASLCRTSVYGVGVALALLLPLLRSKGRETFRTRIAASVVLLVSMLAAIAPWTAHNWYARREFILLSGGSGYALWLGNHPEALALYESSFKSRDDFDDLAYRYLQRDAPNAKIAEWEQSAGYSALSLGARDRLWRDEAVANARKNPSVTARLWAHKTWTYWRPWLRPGPYPRPIVVLSGIVVCSLFVLAAAAIPRLALLPGGRRFLCFLAVLSLGSMMIHTVSVSMVRYRLPYIDPYLCMLAGITVSRYAGRVPALRAISSG